MVIVTETYNELKLPLYEDLVFFVVFFLFERRAGVRLLP